MNRLVLRRHGRAWLVVLSGVGLLSWSPLASTTVWAGTGRSATGKITRAVLGTHASGKPAVVYFKTPSRNIVCQSLSAPAGIECGIKSGLRPPPPRIKCRAGDPTDRFVAMAATGRPHEPSCAGDPGPFTGEPKAGVLHYGHTFHRGGLTCRSAAKGLTCHNKSRHGFFLSRTRSRTF